MPCERSVVRTLRDSIQRMARYSVSLYCAGMRANLPALIFTACDNQERSRWRKGLEHALSHVVGRSSRDSADRRSVIP